MLLTTLDAAEGVPEGAPAVARGFLKIGPGTVARHQLTLALSLEAQLIVCIARGLTPELIELQHAAEAAGARFQVVPGARALAGLVTAADDVYVIADGLLAPPQTARALVEGGPAVLVQPVESGTAAGFERLDVNHAAAGFMRIPGRLVERLNELPPDCDVASALSRIALQSGIARQELPQELREGSDWALVRSEAEAHHAETAWIARHMASDGVLTAGTLLGRLGIKAAGPALLHAGSGGNALAVGAFATVLLALGAGWAGYTATALAFCALAWLIRHMSGLLLRVERESLGRPPERWSREAAFGWVLDAILIAILAWSPQNQVWAGPVERLFAPVMLICMLRVLPRVFERGWVAWARDRAVWAALLAIASASGELFLAVHALAAALGLFAIVVPQTRTRLTRV